MSFNLQSIKLTTFLLLLILTSTNRSTNIPDSTPSPQITLLYNNTPIPIYSNSTLSPLFTPPIPSFSCSNVYKFTYNQTYQQMVDNVPYQIVIRGMDGEFVVTVDSVHGKVKPKQNVSTCVGDCVVGVLNDCGNQRDFDAIRVSVTGIGEIFYNVICDSSLIFSPFQYGLVILVIFSVLQIIICSQYQSCNSYSNPGHYINPISLSLFCLLLIIGQALILIQIPSSTDLVSYMCLTVASVCGVLGVMVCGCEAMWATNVERFRTRFGGNRLGVRVMDVVGFAIGVGVLCGWFFSGYNWIISNFIYICIYVATIKLVKFGSLRIAALTFFSTASLNVIFIVLTQVFRHVYFNGLILYIFNNPFFIFCPCINFTPNENCSWLFITCIVFPGILLSYLDRFDESRSSKIYSIVFVVCFVVSSTVWIVISRFVPFTIPFDLINSPVCFVLLCVFANRRGELQSLWSGEIFDAKHRNKSEQENQLISSLKENSRGTFKSQWFRIKFSNVSSSSMSSAIRNVQNEIQLKDIQQKASQPQPKTPVDKNLAYRNTTN